MKRISNLIICLLIPMATMYAQSLPTVSHTSEKGDMAISVTFNPASLGYKMSCQPSPGDFVGNYIQTLATDPTGAGYPKQMFILSQDPLAAVKFKRYISNTSAFRATLGFNGSIVNYREYVQDDLSVALNPDSQNKVVDMASSRLNSVSLALGAEWKVGEKAIKFIYGVDLLYAIAGGDIVFDYGNMMTDLNHVPSTMPMTSSGGKLDDFKTKAGIAYARPLKRYNSGYIHGIGLLVDAGLELFLAERISLAAAMTFTPVMAMFQPRTYATYEGFSAYTGKVETFTDTVSPGSSAFLYGTENIGCRVTLTYYL